MSDNIEPDTSHGMLSEIRTLSPAGWARFVRIYAPLVYSWIRRAGIQEADSADITQEVLGNVHRSIQRFERRRTGSFRAWLWTITRNEINGWYRAQKKNPPARGGSTNMVRSLPDWIDSDEEPNEADDRGRLIRQAIAVIRSDFQENTWQAFWRRVVDGEPATEIAEDLGMTPAAVRQARFRVLARLRDYVEVE